MAAAKGGFPAPSHFFVPDRLLSTCTMEPSPGNVPGGRPAAPWPPPAPVVRWRSCGRRRPCSACSRSSESRTNSPDRGSSKSEPYQNSAPYLESYGERAHLDQPKSSLNVSPRFTISPFLKHVRSRSLQRAALGNGTLLISRSGGNGQRRAGINTLSFQRRRRNTMNRVGNRYLRTAELRRWITSQATCMRK